MEEQAQKICDSFIELVEKEEPFTVKEVFCLGKTIAKFSIEYGLPTIISLIDAKSPDVWKNEKRFIRFSQLRSLMLELPLQIYGLLHKTTFFNDTKGEENNE